MRIRSRKEREKEYAELYGNVSLDVYERLQDKLGDKFNEDLLNMALDRVIEAKESIEYRCLRFTFYEIPIQAHRPRTNFKFRGLHVPNAKANFDAIEKFIKNIDDELKVITVPMRINLTAYAPMPTTVNPLEMVLYETEHDYAIGKPDFDNILKAYCDMIQKHVIMDDDIVVSSSINKYYSLKPRVGLDIIFPNGVISEYTYKTITHRKSYKDLENYIDAKLLVTPYSKKKTNKRR